MPALVFDRKASLALGVTEIMLGIFSGIFGILAIMCLSSYGYIGYGLWCGMMFIIAGSVSAAAGSRPNKDLITTTVIMSIIALIFAVTLMALAGLGLYSNLTLYGCGSCATSICTEWTSSGVDCIDDTGYMFALTTEIVLIIVGAIETVIAVSTASFACGCYCSSTVDPVEAEPLKAEPIAAISTTQSTTKARYQTEPELQPTWDPSYNTSSPAPQYTEEDMWNPGYVTSA